MAASALAAACLAAVAQAAPSDSFAGSNDFAPQPYKIGPQPPHRNLQWDTRTNRWGLDLEMAQPSGRDVQWGDTRIGVHYRLAPGLKTGVGVTLGPEQQPDGRQFYAPEPAPRVRLETTFKF
nr:hypothetical protein Hi04_10k_c4586_00035 [uncultured bacterium]